MLESNLTATSTFAIPISYNNNPVFSDTFYFFKANTECLCLGNLDSFVLAKSLNWPLSMLRTLRFLALTSSGWCSTIAISLRCALLVLGISFAPYVLNYQLHRRLIVARQLKPIRILFG